MNELVVFILVISCIVVALYQIYKWFNLYSSVKSQSLKVIFEKGFYMPKYILPSNKDFDKEDAKALNKIHVLIYLSMFIGIGVIIVHMILK